MVSSHRQGFYFIFARQDNSVFISIQNLDSLIFWLVSRRSCAATFCYSAVFLEESWGNSSFGLYLEGAVQQLFATLLFSLRRVGEIALLACCPKS